LPERGGEDAVLVLNDGGRRVAIAVAIVERRDNNRANDGLARVESGGGRNPRPAEGLDRAAHAAGGGPVHLDRVELGEPVGLV